MDRKGEIPEGKKPFFRLPIMNYHEARPSSSPLCNPVGNVDRVMSMLTFTVMCWVQGYLSTSYNATYYGRCPACAYLPICAQKHFSHCTSAVASAHAAASVCRHKLVSTAHHGGAELAQRHPEVPRLTAKQREAVRYFNAIAKVHEQEPAVDA